MKRAARTAEEANIAVAIVISSSEDTRRGLGDWCRPRPPSGLDSAQTNQPEPREYYGEVIPMLSTACLFRCADIMAKVETLTGSQDHSEEWKALAEQSRKAGHEQFAATYQPCGCVNREKGND